jgi:hypothetical protein
MLQQRYPSPASLEGRECPVKIQEQKRGYRLSNNLSQLPGAAGRLFIQQFPDFCLPQLLQQITISRR